MDAPGQSKTLAMELQLRPLFENVAVGVGWGATMTAVLANAGRPALAVATLAFGAAYLLKK